MLKTIQQFGLRDTSYWLMPSQKRQVEPLVVEPSKTKTNTPIPSASAQAQHNLTTKGLDATLLLEAQDTAEAYQKEIDRLKNEQLGHFEYKLPSTGKGETWEHALRSTMRTIDAAEMEVERHHRWIIDNKSVLKWELESLSVLRARKEMPTRTNQEILLEIAAHGRLGPPTTQTQSTMQDWITKMDVSASLGVDLRRFIVNGQQSRLWTNDFTHAIDHSSGAEPSMFFICQHEYAVGETKWIVGATTPLTGQNKRKKWVWAEDVYKAVRDQAMGTAWVDRVDSANTRQKNLENELVALDPLLTPSTPKYVPLRQQVLAELRSDAAHQRLVARVACKGLAINRTMVPTQCCYRCQANFQYNVLTKHMKETDTENTEHLRLYSWNNQCAWPHQCAEASAACHCEQFDDRMAEANRPSSARLLSKKKSTANLFGFKR